jgi:hypothetical protein
MTFRDEFKALVKKHDKMTTLANDRPSVMAAVCLQELGWDAAGFAETEARHGPIVRRMKFLERFKP